MANLPLKDQLKAELPALLEDREVRELLVRAISGYFAGESVTETRFDRLLAELVRDREEQSGSQAGDFADGVRHGAGDLPPAVFRQRPQLNIEIYSNAEDVPRWQA